MRGRFTASALAPLAVNIGLILTLLVLEADFALPLAQKAAWLAGASSLAGAVQLALVAAALYRREERIMRFRFPRRSPALKGLLLAGFPALIASGAVQLFILVATQVASFSPSAVSWLYYAEKVMQLPLGLMAALASSVLLPELALRHRTGQADIIVDAQNRALEVALLLALPASAALVILAEPMAAILFERGAFTAADSRGTALVLMALSLGLPAATAAKVLSQTLFANGSLRGTLMATVIGMAVTLAASLGLAWLLGPTGIALGVSLGCLAHAGATIGLLRRLGLWSPDRPFATRLGRIAAATLVMSTGLLLAKSHVPPANSLSLAAFCVGGLALYGLAARAAGAVTRDDWARLTKKS
jgi:putative peptidoglycan lipid II flippase